MTTTTTNSNGKRSQLYLPNSDQIGTTMYPWVTTPDARREVAAMNESGFAVLATFVQPFHRVALFSHGAATEWSGAADFAHTTAITRHRDGSHSILMSTRGDLMCQHVGVYIAAQAAIMGAQLLRRGYRCPTWDGVAPEVEFPDLDQIDPSMREGLCVALSNLQGMLHAQKMAEQIVWQFRRAVREVADLLLSDGQVDGARVAALVSRDGGRALAA